jgi:uncharacterized membrane protein YagU involved in acid resistance
MSTVTLDQKVSAPSSKLVASGAIAGLAGGAVFGMMMAMMGMLPMVGMLVRQENAIIGFVVHMVISAFIGAVYGLVAGRFAQYDACDHRRMINGVIWYAWRIILMPLMLGMSQMVFVIGQAQWLSLMGMLSWSGDRLCLSIGQRS